MAHDDYPLELKVLFCVWGVRLAKKTKCSTRRFRRVSPEADKILY